METDTETGDRSLFRTRSRVSANIPETEWKTEQKTAYAAKTIYVQGIEEVSHFSFGGGKGASLAPRRSWSTIMVRGH